MLDPSLIPLVQRLDRDPEDREAVETLCRELDGRGEHEVLAMLLEKVSGRRRTPEGTVELLHRAALTWSGKVGDDPKALKLWNQVLEAQPDHEGALLGTATVFRRTNRREQAEAVYQRLLAKAISPAKKVPVLEALAGLCAERELPEKEIETRRELAAQQGAGAAATSNRRSLARLLVERSRKRRASAPLAEGEVDPDQREAASLLGLVAKEGATGRAVEFAQAALSLWSGEESAFQVLEESGSLKQAELTTLRIQFLAANPKGARGQRVRRDLADAYVATQRPEDAITVLSAAVDDDPQAAQSLAKLYERLGRHLDLAKLLDRLPTPEEPDARLALLRRRAQVWKQSGQKPQHLAALRALLDETPADTEALAEVERDCRLQGLLGELRDRLRAAAKVEGVEAAAKVRWLREVAQLAERRFDDVADARAAWEALERVAEGAEDRAEAQESLLRLMGRVEDWDRVLERLAAQAEAEPDPSESRRLWLRWVQVRREHRSDAEREAEVLGRLWEKHPEDDAVGRLLVDARRRANDDLGVTEVLYALIQRSTAGSAAARWSQLAEHLERVGDTESSALAWQNARTVDPTNALAWEAEARLLGALGDREAQLTTLVAYADHPVAPGRRAGELYGRAAHLAFELGRKDRARQLAERALRFSPDDDAMKSLLATLDDPGTAPLSFEELLAEVARRDDAEKAAAAPSGPITETVEPVTEKTPVAVKAPVGEEAPVAVKAPVEEKTPVAVKVPVEEKTPVAVKAPVEEKTPVAVKAPEADEPTGIVTVEQDAVEEPTGAVALEPGAPDEPDAVEREAAAEPPPDAITEPPKESHASAAEPEEATTVATPKSLAATPATHEAAAVDDETPDDLSDDALEELLAEPEPVSEPEPEPEPEPTATIVTVAAPAPAPAPAPARREPLPPVESEERTPLDGVVLPEAAAATAELAAPPAPPIEEPAPEPGSVTAELTIPPTTPQLPEPPPQAPPPTSNEDSIIIDESLFGDPAPAAAAPAPAPVLAAPAPAPAPTSPPPAAPARPLPSLPTLPRQRIATAIPPSMPAPAFTPRAPDPPTTPSFTPRAPDPPTTPSFTPRAPDPPTTPSFTPRTPEPAPPEPAPTPPLQFNPQPAVAEPPPPALQFNPQPVAVAPPPPALQFNPQPVAVAPPPPALQFNPQPVAVVAPPPPALQFNPQPVAVAPPPPALQFNPQPIAVTAPPPPALQFNPQPVVTAPPPPALQFNPQPAAPPSASPGDPFARVSGDWVVDASGDPFAQSSAPAVAAPPAPEAYAAPQPPAPQPPPPQPPPPAAQAPAFERVLLPMLEKLLHG